MPSDKLIAAGHGYILPDSLPLPAELRQTPVIPFAEAEQQKIPVWVTEISDITPLDTSMEDGLRWATTFHHYLEKAHVSAIVWWAGAQPTGNNESLIVLTRQQVSSSCPNVMILSAITPDTSPQAAIASKVNQAECQKV